jgi:glucosamine 6-phosphate synthetase-like amidotransferase/phosphosugar isomerase protein
VPNEARADRPADRLLDERAREVLACAEQAERDAAALLPGDDPLDPKRRLRTDATRPELLAQPDVVARNWGLNEDALAHAASRIQAFSPTHAYLVGAGDSLAVMIAARLALESALGIPCEPIQSLELAFYGAHLLNKRSLVIALSSSGETTRTLEAALIAQAAGALTLALTNKPQSTLAREADSTILVDATRRGWPTQSSTAALGLLLRLAALMDHTHSTLAELDRVPELMQQTIAAADPVIASQALAEASGSMFLFAGGGPSYGAAVVGAAKVKECTPDHAIAVELEEFHHYNSQKVGEALWMLVPAGPSVERGVHTIEEADRLGGHVYAITTEGINNFDGRAQEVLHLPPVSEMLSPLLYFLPAQLVGYHLEVAKRELAAAG